MRHPTAELPVEGGVSESSEGFGPAHFSAQPAGGWIRMPVRAPVTDPELCASVQKDGETSGAKFVLSGMTTHR